jgi:hypothetical protein
MKNFTLPIILFLFTFPVIFAQKDSQDKTKKINQHET